jgi:Tol biopolymer transport system component
MRSIQWLPEEKRALFLIDDPNTKGNGPSTLYLYSRVDNTTKKVYPFKEQVLNMFLSPDSKKLYYVFTREDKKLTGVLSLESII